jgi:hypothetical protein
MSFGKTTTYGGVKRWRSNTLLSLGMVLILWLLGTAFLLTPTQAQAPTAHQVSSAAGWTGWSQVPGNGATPSGPATTQYKGKDYLFVRGTDDRIYVNIFNGSSWTGWNQVPGNGATPDAPAATQYGNNLYLFVRGTDNRIYVNALKLA